MLTPKQKRFCEEYVIDLNGTQAAIRAGYSKKTSYAIAEQNLKKLELKRYIKELQEEIRLRSGITADMVIEELAKVGFSNIQDFVSKDNSTVDLSEIQKEKAAAVAGVKVITSTYGQGKQKTVEKKVEFKLYDKVQALEKLGRHLGIFEKDNSQKKPDAPQVIVPGNGNN